NQNWVPGETLSTEAIVGVGSGGSITLANRAGDVDAIVDVDGYFAEPGDSGSLFDALSEPVRLVDTRPSPVGGGKTVPVSVAGSNGVPSNAVAGVLNVADLATGPNYLTTYPAGSSVPLAANLNYVPGDSYSVVDNASYGTVGALGGVGIFVGPDNAAPTNIVVDEFGYFVPAPAVSPAPKVMIVMMENQGYSNIIGNPAMPFTNSLASNYGLATESYSFAHPSLPNYLTIVSGSNQGVTTDIPPSSKSFPGTPTLASQLVSGGYSVAAFAESLPSDPTNDSGLYAVRHVPWEYFPGTPITVEDSSALMPALNSASPPDFVWYTPNLTDDGHTGVPTDNEANELADADSFLSTFIPEVQATSWYSSGGQIVIEWDEALDSDTTGVNGGSGGHITTIVVSAELAATPEQYTGQVDTAGILHSLEDLYQLPYLAGAGDPANGNIDPLLHQ
ncbi:MAG: alkaline phosphatase family protein, partial [Nitrososphaerales archaeon]